MVLYKCIWPSAKFYHIKNTAGREPRKANKMNSKENIKKGTIPVEELELFMDNVKRERKRETARRIRPWLIGALIILLIVGVIFAVMASLACNPTTPVPTVTPTHDVAVSTPTPTTMPTEVATEVPTEAPTPEPTATPIPEDWYIDPLGIIPAEVEILVPDQDTTDNTERWCATMVEGKAVVQLWTPNGLSKEWVVPDEILQAKSLYGFYDGDLVIYAYLTDDQLYNFLYYLENNEGKFMFFHAKSYFGASEECLIATMDGKAIWYHWGDDFYLMYDFGVNGKVVEKESIDWEKKFM